MDTIEPFSSTILAVHEVAHHRNGVDGCPFYVVTFTSRSSGDKCVGIVFCEDGDGDVMSRKVERRIAVMGLDKLSRGVIAFQSNSYRGNVFKECLLKAIDQRNKLEAAKFARNTREAKSKP